jgi:hypothetical protein
VSHAFDAPIRLDWRPVSEDAIIAALNERYAKIVISQHPRRSLHAEKTDLPP